MKKRIFIRNRVMVRRTVYDVPWQNLYEQGFRWVAFDIENTLEPISKDKRLRPETVEFLVGLIQIGFWGISLCTNSLSNFQGMVSQLVNAGLSSKHILLIQPDKPKKPWLRKNPRKPKKSYFDRVWRSGVFCDKRWVIFVGDKLDFDVLPAIEAGFYGIWINRLAKDLPLEFPRRWREAINRRRLGLVHPRSYGTISSS